MSHPFDDDYNTHNPASRTEQDKSADAARERLQQYRIMHNGMQSTLESTAQSLRMLGDSEREHLNSFQSIFGGIKNYFGKKKATGDQNFNETKAPNSSSKKKSSPSRADQSVAQKSELLQDKLATMSNAFDDDYQTHNPAFRTDEDNAADAATEELQQYRSGKHNDMQSILESTAQSLRMLDEVERIGIETAENLYHHREQLENADRKLDEMKATTKLTQQHHKSTFDGIKHYFGIKKKATGDQNFNETKASNSSSKKKSSASRAHKSVAQKSERLQDTKDMWRIDGLQDDALIAMDDEINENLSLMANDLSRLRMQSTALNSEISSQNELLDNIGLKVDETDTMLWEQHRQSHKILNVKPKDIKKAKAKLGDEGRC